jgi:hypothetical protein
LIGQPLTQVCANFANCTPNNVTLTYPGMGVSLSAGTYWLAAKHDPASTPEWGYTLAARPIAEANTGAGTLPTVFPTPYSWGGETQIQANWVCP